ncbi:DMT family transporter [Streptomyces vinaceus]
MNSLSEPFPWKSMAATAILWGSAFPVITVVLRVYSPAEAALLRMCVAILLLLPLAIWGRIGFLRLRDMPRMAVFGLAGMTGYQLLLYSGEQSVDAGMAATLIATAPVFITLLCIPLLGERPGLRGAIGLVTALCGALLTATTSGRGGSLAPGGALVLAAAVAQAVSVVAQKPLLVRYSGTECIFYGSLFGFMPLLPILPSAVLHAEAADWHSAVSVIWLGAGCTVLAYWTWGRALSAMTAAASSLVLYAVPVVALIADAAFNGTSPAYTTVLGGILVLAGVAVAAARQPTRSTDSPVVDREAPSPPAADRATAHI